MPARTVTEGRGHEDDFSTGMALMMLHDMAIQDATNVIEDHPRFSDLLAYSIVMLQTGIMQIYGTISSMSTMDLLEDVLLSYSSVLYGTLLEQIYNELENRLYMEDISTIGPCETENMQHLNEVMTRLGHASDAMMNHYMPLLTNP